MSRRTITIYDCTTGEPLYSADVRLGKENACCRDGEGWIAGEVNADTHSVDPASGELVERPALPAAAPDYRQQRSAGYPPITDFVDAWVRGDDAALEEYRQQCLAVKAQFPKP